MLALPALQLLQVVPCEDHTPDTPTNVSMTTGQQLQRAGSGTAMRPERECVGKEKVTKERKEKCEYGGRPVSSCSSSKLSSSCASKEGIRAVSSELTVRPSPPACRSGPAALQVRPVATAAVAKVFSYAQVLKSAGRSSSTPSSQYSSRSETPSLTSVHLAQTQEGRVSKSVSSSRSDSPGVCVLPPSDGDIIVNVETILEDVQTSSKSTSPTDSCVDVGSIKDDCGESDLSEIASSVSEMITDGNIVVGGFELEDLSFKVGEMTFPAIETLNVVGNEMQQAIYSPVDVTNIHVEADSNDFPQAISNNSLMVEAKKLDQLATDLETPSGFPDALERVPSSTMLNAMSKTDGAVPQAAVASAPIETSPPTQTRSSDMTDFPARPATVAVPTMTATQPQDHLQTTRPFEAHTVAREPSLLGSSAGSMPPTVQSHLMMRIPPLNMPSTHLTTRAPMQAVSHLPARSLIRPSLTPAVQFPAQTQIPLQHGEFQRQQALMPTPSVNTLPDQLFSNEGPSLSFYRALADLQLGLPASMPPPVRNVKSNEQLEAIAKVKEHMATTSMLEAQRKNKGSSQSDQSSHSGGPAQLQPGIPSHGGETRLNSAQHMAKAKQPISRNKELMAQQLSKQALSANQTAYYKQAPLLIQPPQTGRQSLLPGQPSPVPTAHQVPHVPQLTAQQYLLMKQQVERAAMFQYQQSLKQQALKMVTPSENTAVSTFQPFDPLAVQYHAYPHPQIVNPLLHTSVQSQTKSAFSPYPTNSAELGRVPAQRVLNSTAHQIYSTHDQTYTQGPGQENRKLVLDTEKPSSLSASAIPFVPCTAPGNTSEGHSTTTTAGTGTDDFLLKETSTVDRPPSSQPILYNPKLQMRAPPKAGAYPFISHSVPAGVSAPGLLGQSMLPVQIPQNIMQLTQSQVNLANVAAQQRKPPLTTGIAGAMPRAYPAVTEGQQAPSSKVLHQMVLESHKAVMARQYSGEGTSLLGLRNKDFHLSSGSRKPGYSPGSIDLYSKQNITGGGNASQMSIGVVQEGPMGGNASQMSVGLIPDGPIVAGKPTSLLAPSLSTHRRTALLPTPVTSHVPLLISEPSRITQGVGQQWSTPQRHVVPLSLNQPAQILATQDQLQQQANSLYNSMVGGAGGHQY